MICRCSGIRLATRSIFRDDLQVRILGHTRKEFVRSSETGAAAEYQSERIGVGTGDGAQRERDLQVLFNG